MSKLTQTMNRFKENMKKTGSFAVAIPHFYYKFFFYPSSDYGDLILLASRIIAVLVSPLSTALSAGALVLAACAAIALTLFLPFQCVYAKIYDACEPIDDVDFGMFEPTGTTDTDHTTGIDSGAGIDNTKVSSQPQTSTGEQPPTHYSSPLSSEKSSPSNLQHSTAKPPTEPGRAPAPGGI